MSHLSRMKNPVLPCLSVAAALRAYNYLIPARVYYVLARPCQLIAVLLFPIS
ncbi:uncharacterized protein K441DRAFT_651415 [Cenococcum geophilum 1.58]|uniref:uncharacterized protein n=1 Tax=Cenococcum geophilum 1.58 TaxID=794803 RepID=UPI00358F8249|nr:hypothetical protein K441DRAFT_651415 [Cenococcum geophilum 1.58]